MIGNQTILSKPRTGLTLVELILVIAILAILAALILPKLDGLQSNAGHAAGASSATDLYGLLQVYKITKHAYPDGWDTLMTADGSGLWSASQPSGGTNDAAVPGLDGELLQGTPPLLTSAELTATDISALNSAGITQLFNLGTAASNRPGDMFTAVASLSTGQNVAIIAPGTTNTTANKIIDHIYPANSLSTGTSGTLGTGVNKLVVFGFGPHNAMVGKMVSECPVYPNVDPAVTYNRLLVVFEVTNTKATVRTVLGADGDLINDMIANTSKTPS